MDCILENIVLINVTEPEKLFNHKISKMDFVKMLPFEEKLNEALFSVEVLLPEGKSFFSLKLKIQRRLLRCTVVSGPPFYSSLGFIWVPQCR